MSNLIPYVVEKTAEGERSYDLYSRLLNDRIVMLCGEVNEASMNIAVSELLYLNSQDASKPIFLYIQSPGGSVQDGLALIDTMKFISAPVYTVCIGVAASMGAAILSAGEPGHRYALKNSSILIHSMSGGTEGTFYNNVVNINYEKRLNAVLLAEIGHNCGKISDAAYEEIFEKAQSAADDRDENLVLKFSKATEKELKAFKNISNYDNWMFPKAAKEFGIVDTILTSEKELTE